MSKSNQARELFQSGMSVAEISKKLQMHYSHVSSAIKSMNSSINKVSQQTKQVKRNSDKFWRKAILTKNTNHILQYLAHYGKDIDWCDVFMDKDICSCLWNDSTKQFIVTLHLLDTNKQSCSIVCPFDSQDVQNYLNQIPLLKDKLKIHDKFNHLNITIDE